MSLLILPAGGLPPPPEGKTTAREPGKAPVCAHVAKSRTPAFVTRHSSEVPSAWKSKYGGMDVSEAQEAKRLRDENARLRKLVAT
jgi:hypothetical protein